MMSGRITLTCALLGFAFVVNLTALQAAPANADPDSDSLSWSTSTGSIIPH
jgi:hypothetical protein